MPTELSIIAAIRTLALGDLAELMDGPDHTDQQQAATWATSVAALRQLIDWCDAKLADGQPFELRSRATT